MESTCLKPWTLFLWRTSRETQHWPGNILAAPPDSSGSIQVKDIRRHLHGLLNFSRNKAMETLKMGPGIQIPSEWTPLLSKSISYPHFNTLYNMISTLTINHCWKNGWMNEWTKLSNTIVSNPKMHTLNSYPMKSTVENAKGDETIFNLKALTS